MKYYPNSLCLLLLLSGVAFGHARFKPNSATPPRNDSTGLKSPPCGSVARTTTPKVYKPGEEIKVEWEETINHPGFFILSFSKENELGFKENVLIEKYVDDQNGSISDAAYHQFSATVKLPNVTCTGCTLQLIQHMDDAPDRPYYSCSDIQLVDPAGGATPPPTTSNPTTGGSGETGKAPGQKPSKPQGLKIETPK